jgi:hypothetical protein
LDSIFILIVHTDTDQQFDVQRLLGRLPSRSSLIHLLELVDHPIFQVELSEVVAVRTLLVEYLADVACFNSAGICAHRDALVINFLLVDSR